MRYGILFIALLFATAHTVSASSPDTINTAKAKSSVLTRCEAPVEFSDRHQYVALATAPGAPVIDPVYITLIRQADNRYALMAGSELIGADTNDEMPTDKKTVHLVLDNGSGMEHFLFVLNQDNSGELLWSSATASALTTCTAEI
jgi:hypothetical protein